MNSLYKDIPPEELGKFIKEILSTFINRNDLSSVYNVGLKYNLTYSYIENDNCGLVRCLGKYGNNPLIVRVHKNKILSNRLKYESIIMLDEKNVYLGIDTVQKYSTDNFFDDHFALSTILSPQNMYNLQLSTYFSDIPLDNDGIILRMDKILMHYTAIHTTPHKGTTR